MLKWGAVQDGTPFPEFNHARLLETWKLLLQFTGKQQKYKKMKSIALYSIAFLQEK